MELLKQMCGIHAPAGNEVALKDFILKYIEDNKSSWDYLPEIYEGDGFQERRGPEDSPGGPNRDAAVRCVGEVWRGRALRGDAPRL